VKKNLSKLFIFGLFLFLVLGCGALSKIKQGIDDAQKPKTIISTDGKCQVTVPGGWQKQTDLNDEAIIQAANPIGELYVIVLPENKAGIGDTDLDDAAGAVRDSLTKMIPGAVLSPPISTTINGLPARQFEVGAEVEHLKVTYLYAVVDAPETFYQVITWTLTPRLERNRGKLLEVINSFKETGKP
jgi:hypothetical protein